MKHGFEPFGKRNRFIPIESLDEESGDHHLWYGWSCLEILVDRMKREFGVGAAVGAPQVAYRETIRKAVEVEGKHVQQSGGKGQYGHAVIKMEPLEPGGVGYEFLDEIKGGVILRNSSLQLTKVFVIL